MIPPSTQAVTWVRSADERNLWLSPNGWFASYVSAETRGSRRGRGAYLRRNSIGMPPRDRNATR